MYNFNLNILDYELAKKSAPNIKTGNKFLFAENQQWFKQANNKQRLQIESIDNKPSVKALLPNGQISLCGLEINTHVSEAGWFSAVIPDRDLYKAEQDTINILVVYPQYNEIHSAMLMIEFAGQEHSSIDIKKTLISNNGTALESLSMLLSGQYTVRLFINDNELNNANFTVAEYQLSPFSGRLVSHTLDSDKDSLSFELCVESYELPWDKSIEILLLEDNNELERITLAPISPKKFPGIFKGCFNLDSNGPFSLRLIASDDASRVAEISLPGSARAQRQVTLISELGEEVNFSMLPIPESIPVRGGFLQRGVRHDIPVQINNCLTDKPTLEIKQDTSALAVLTCDIIENCWHEYSFDDLSAGDEIAITRTSNMMMVYVGAWVNDQPFEGFATVLSKKGLELSLASKDILRPGDNFELDIRLKNNADDYSSQKPLAVYLNIRDSRLTSSNTPQTALGECLKEHIEFLTENYSDYELHPLNQHQDFVNYFDFRRHRLMKCGSAPVEMASPMHEIDYCLSKEQPSEFMEALALGKEAADKPNEPNDSRSEFPDSLFCGLIYLRDQETLQLKLGDSLGKYNIDAFVYDNGNWASARHEFIVDQAVRADLDFPPVVEPGDMVYGRVRAQTSSGKAKIELLLDDEVVELPRSINSSKVNTPLEFDIQVEPGQYTLNITDLKSNEIDSVKVQITAPGKVKSLSNALQLLQENESISLDSYPGTIQLELLPGFDHIQEKLVSTTADYSHLCCEQTAAKMLAASAMYIASEDIVTRQKAEKILLAGAAREAKMITNKGFIMYPDNDYHSEYYSKLAVQYLWQLQALQQFSGLSDSLSRALQQCIEYADRAAKFHKLKKHSASPTTMAEAWQLACKQPMHSAISTLIDNTIDIRGKIPKLKVEADPVYMRTNFAYASACLLLQGKVKEAIKLANHVMQEINDTGSLYSTVDSVALIAMLSSFKSHDFFKQTPKVRVNGQIVDPATLDNTHIESIEVLNGNVLVQVTQIVEHNWLESKQSMNLSTKLATANGKTVFDMGELITMNINLDDGYINGDLAHISLPAGLSWIQGGGRVKQFSIDFAGDNQIEIPLLVTSKIDGPQHFAVVVRNMFEEERIACPGLIKVA